jgi:V/A-type H+-transporting ATPase subunit A
MNASVHRVNGPLVEVAGVSGVAMGELLEVGERRLPAEVIALRGDVATTQAYEYTGAIRPGGPVRMLGRTLSAKLGPGLTGHVFDGLLRPLDEGPTWLAPGSMATNDGRAWPFTPATEVGRSVRGGDLLGTVDVAGPITHRVLVPNDLAGTVRQLCAAGRYREDEPVAVIDGTVVTLVHWWDVRRPRPVRARVESRRPLLTGQRVLDALFPVTKGGTASVPGGFGTGKTVLLQQIAKWCDADVIVYVGCGERGNELADVLAEIAELADPRTGGRLADRTVLIANTSNMPIMAREASIYTGVTVAEYYRDMGYDVVVIADSTSRWAEALREFGSRTGALPAEEGYPANLASALAAFYERAGQVETLGGGLGSVTVIGAVSPPGGDLAEPVTVHTQRFVRTLWTLDRELAYSRHYPAVAWSGSYCRDAADVGAWYAGHGDPDWAARRASLSGALADADRLAALAELVGIAALPDHERVALLSGRLVREAILQQSSLSSTDAQCAPEKTAALATAVFSVVAVCRELVESGLAVTTVESADFTDLIRLRELTPPDDADGVRRGAARLVERLRTLS